MAKPKRREWEEVFLRILAATANVRLSSKYAGINYATAYRHRQKDPEFAERWDDALADGLDALELEARRRALDGSDLLLIFLLKAYRPDVFASRRKVVSVTRIERSPELPPLSNEELLAIAEGRD